MRDRKRIGAPEGEAEAVTFVRDIVWNAVWNVEYNRWRLPMVYAEKKYAVELLERVNIDPSTVTEADETEEGETLYEDFNSYARSLLANAMNLIDYYERALEQGQKQLAFATMMLIRGDYKIDIEDLRKLIQTELARKD